MPEDNATHANTIEDLYSGSAVPPLWRAHAAYCDRVADAINAALTACGITVEPGRIEASPRLYLAQLVQSDGSCRASLRWTETTGWGVSQPEQERYFGAQPDQVDVLSDPGHVAAWVVDVLHDREAVLAPRDWRSATDRDAPTGEALRFEERLLHVGGHLPRAGTGS